MSETVLVQPDAPVTITEAAAQRLRAIAAKDPTAQVMRLAVNAGGCSGFSYDIRMEPAPEAGDIIVERDGAVVAIDPICVELVQGSSVDWVEELIGAQFKISNPKAVAACGCGVSFSI
jgi:iron-sulfur cluster insertion protein